MVRYSWLIGAMALAAPLAAQAPTGPNPFQETFDLQGGASLADPLAVNQPHIYIAADGSTSTTPQSGYGDYLSSPYAGAFATGANTYTPSFLVWCVDEKHDSYFGETYSSWVTPLSQSDFSHTRLGASEANAYRWAAVLAGDMSLDWEGANQVADQKMDVELQTAMWALLGEEPNNNALTTLITDYGSTLGLGANFYAGTAPTSNTNWALITCDLAANPSCSSQEFLVELPSGPKEIVPEPTTMSLLAAGLATMSAAGLRRRKRRTA